ncbi:hypothetical protein CRUP_013006, partial [Coryphaenoides rupestris]
SEKNQLKWAEHRLETDVCVAGHQAPNPEAIQNYVKKIRVLPLLVLLLLVLLLYRPGGGPCFLGPWDPEELSSLHSSPSPIHRHTFSSSGGSPSDPAQPARLVSEEEEEEPGPRPQRTDPLEDRSSTTTTMVEEPGLGGPSPPPSPPGQNCFKPASEEDPHTPTPNDGIYPTTAIPQDPHNPDGRGLCSRGLCPMATETMALVSPLVGDHHHQYQHSPPGSRRRRRRTLPQPSDPADTHLASPLLLEHRGHRTVEAGSGNGGCQETQGEVVVVMAASHNNNNHIWKGSEKERQSDVLPPMPGEHTLGSESVREAGLTTEVDAHWLDHMTQHFSSGARLIDGFFHLADDHDSGISSVDSVFIFQSSSEDSSVTSYDAIVVEQWTVVDGVVVRTDYVPLLQSLAPYGWRLMCVLPTPVVRTNSDGSLSTKQFLFLQRPTLQRKRKDFKMLNLRGRSKARRSYAGETPEKERERERESASPVSESEVDELLRNTKEEEEEVGEDEMEGEAERKEEENREGAADTWGGEEEEEEEEEEAITREAEHHTEPSLSLASPSPMPPSEGGGVSDGNRVEEEEEEEESIMAEREESVRWTDVCRRADGGVEEEMKRGEEEMKIKPQLSERALFSGVC